MSSPIVSSESPWRPLVRLVLPALAEQLLFMLVGFSDALLAGWYFEEPHLAAIGVLVYLIWMLESMFAVVAIGGTAMTARFTGAGDRAMAGRVLHQAFLLGMIFSLVITVAGLALGPKIVTAMNLTGDSARLATRYLYVVFPALPAMMCSAVGIACLRGAGDMITGLLGMMLVNVVNIAVAWPLVLGLGPLPHLGWDGLAIGALVGYLSGALWVLARLLRGRGGLQLRPRQLWPDRDLIARLLRIGIPGGIDVASVVACQLWFVAIINRLGDISAAAHGVAIRIESLAYLPGVALQVAAATLAGQYLGAGDLRRARQSVLMACGLALATLGTAGVVFYWGADDLVRLLVAPERVEVQRLAAPLLRLVAFGMPALALMMVLTGALRGAGDTRWPMVFTLVGFLAVRIPATYLLAIDWEWGVLGAWFAMLADVLCRTTMVIVRFLRGGWQRVHV